MGLLYYGQNFLIYPSAFPAGVRESELLSPFPQVAGADYTHVHIPTDFSIPYADVELMTPDNVKIKAFLVLQRAVLNMGEMSVEWEEGSPSDEDWDWGDAEAVEDIDSNESPPQRHCRQKGVFDGCSAGNILKDPECAGGLERMAYSMDDFVRRVFMDSLTGSYELSITHRFASHVIQTLLNVAAGTIARESQNVLPKVEDSFDKGQLRTLTQLIIDFSEEILPSLRTLIMDQFASHVVRALFLLICPHLFSSSTPHRSQAFVRSRKSAAWKARQGPLTSIFGDTTDKGKASAERRHPAEIREVAKRYVTTLRTTLDENEVRSLAASKVACPVLQMALERPWPLRRTGLPYGPCPGRLDFRISRRSLIVPQANDYLVTLLRDPTSSHLLETLVSRCPEPVFGILWTTYFERNLRKFSMHPVANFVVAKALERAKAKQLSYALCELRDSLGKLRQSRIGILRALIECAATLTILEAEVCEVCHPTLTLYFYHMIPALAICFALEINNKEEDRKAFVPWALSLKSKSEYAAVVEAKAMAPPDPGSPEDRSKNIESLQPQELLALTYHPAGSRVPDAIIDGATTPPRARRSLLRALEAHFADVIDDRIGSRVGARCWAAADPYLKEKLARALLCYLRKPEEWRRLHATPSVFASASGGVTSSTSTSAPASASAAPAPVPYTTSGVVGPAPGGKERKKRKRGVSKAEDEIDALFEGALGRKVARTALVVEDSGAAPAPTPSTVLGLPTNATRQDQNVDCDLGQSLTRSGRRRGAAKGRKSGHDDQDDEVVGVRSLIYGKQE
ncbi:ARM repeat-containing protein [Lactarius psammicola]|nr:ARM repeat-containing protein [Lactarius psammicola]